MRQAQCLRPLKRVLLASWAALGLCQCQLAPTTSWPVSPAALGSSGRVLMVGDSLSVGAFGEAIQQYLFQKVGTRKTYLYASCGSSVQHWLSFTDTFTSSCGYRETRPGVQRVMEHAKGRRPVAMPTPKIETLLRNIRPDTLIVQLGTNHYDDLKRLSSATLREERARIETFAAALDSNPHRPRFIIWIAPPDSSRYSNSVENAVEHAILESCRRHRIMVVRSRALTRYQRGRSGSDGVHYNETAAKAWAAWVIRGIDPRF
jgi:hypothetical protein